MGSYYDIDAILTDAQKVPCLFEIAIPSLGFLGSDTSTIKQGTKADLPLWLGEMLAVSQNLSTSAVATIDIPLALSSRVMNALKADARTVDLRSQASHYYSFAARMLELFEDEEMVEVLTETFRRRIVEIADQSRNPRGALGEGADFMQGLEESERQLFRAAHDGAKAVRTWIADSKKK